MAKFLPAAVGLAAVGLASKVYPEVIAVSAAAAVTAIVASAVLEAKRGALSQTDLPALDYRVQRTRHHYIVEKRVRVFCLYLWVYAQVRGNQSHPKPVKYMTYDEAKLEIARMRSREENNPV